MTAENGRDGRRLVVSLSAHSRSTVSVILDKTNTVSSKLSAFPPPSPKKPHDYRIFSNSSDG